MCDHTADDAKTNDDQPRPDPPSDGATAPESAKARPSSIKGTSGRGYRFETQAGVWFAAAMLARTAPLPRHGAPVRVRFMTDDEGWVFDDQLVTFDDGHRLAVSLKSNQQFGKRKDGYVADQKLVAEAWADALGQGAPSFDPERDRLALSAPPPPAELAAPLEELQTLARNGETAALNRRMTETASLKKLYESFAAPAALATTHPASWLLARFEIVALDFESPMAPALEQSLNWCRDALDPASAEQAADLYEALYLRIDEIRTSGGEFTTASFIAELRTRFPLRHLAPSQAKARLDTRTERNLALLPDSLAKTLQLKRETVRAELVDALARERYLAIIGRSGAGKTVVSARVLDERDDYDLVWIAAADLEAEGASVEADAARALTEASAPLAVVVIDGLDRSYEASVFRHAARIIQLALASSEWKVAFTAVTDSLPRVIEQLAANAVVHVPARHEIPLLTLSDLSEVAEAFPQLRPLLANATFQVILSNPKQLDLLVRTATPETTPTESGLARLFWEKLVLRGANRHERAQFLEHLAERQATELEASTARSELADVSALVSLEDDDICVVRQGRVSFSHDLYGDWTRVWLVETNEDNLDDYLKARLHSPLWNRAIRLRASSFLSAGDLDGWRAFRTELPADDPVIDDLFVEAALYAASPADALRALWGDLAAENGFLLKRFLVQLRLVATTPNAVMVALLQAVDPSLESYARVMNRDPIWPLWVPALQVLAEHRDEVVALAPTSAAQVAALWLERTPKDWPLRAEAAQIALAHGRQMYELKRGDNAYVTDDADDIAYQSLLTAAPDLPKEVSDLALRLAARLDPQPRRYRHDPDAVPWPDGPQGKVDGTFREVCLKTAALQPLMRARPNIAAEVLLALLIAEPRERESFDFGGRGLLGEEFGLQPIHYWTSAMWHRGPFIGFLQVAPVEAIRFVASLINFVTDRCIEAERAEGYEPGSVDVTLAGGARISWKGDARVYGWFRGSAPQNIAVASALMALERFLYQRLDAGEDVEELVQLILSEATSVAFAGVLVAAGLHSQHLFASVLKPLLAVPELYEWDRQRVIALESSAGALVGFLPSDPAPLVEQEREFHALKHRRLTLEYFALSAYLNRFIDLDDFFSEARSDWLARANGLPAGDAEREALERLARRFDRDNYKAVPHAQGQQWSFTGADELDDEAQRQVDQASEMSRLLMLPMQIRKVLDNELAMDEEQFGELLRFAREQEELEPRIELTSPADEIEQRANVICGAAAIGIEKFRDWLRAHPDEETWCSATLLRYLSNPPENEHGHYFPGTPWDWHVFCAHALPTLWSEAPTSEELRHGAALLSMFPNEAAVIAFSQAAARERQLLSDEYIRLQRFVLDWALISGEMRDLMNRRQWSQPDDGETKREMQERSEAAAASLSERQRELVVAFVTGNLEPVIPQWSETALVDPRPRSSEGRRRNQPHVVTDIEYITHALAGLPNLDSAISEDERARIIVFWSEAVRYLVGRLGGPANDDREVDGTPYQSDYWLLGRLGRVVAEMRPEEEPDSLWRPILDIASGAHYWVDDFLRAFIGVGLAEPRPQHFVAIWREMVAYARASDAWNATAWRGFHLADNWVALLGFDSILSRQWTARNRDVADAIADEYELVLPQLLDDDRMASGVGYFLREDAAAALRPRMLALLADAADRTGLWHDRNDRIATALAETLEKLFSQGDAAVRTSAFAKLLRHLASRQIPLAVELLNRLGRT